jgi:hypothetical protein
MPDDDLTQFVRPWLQYAPKPAPRGNKSYVPSSATGPLIERGNGLV